MTVTLRDVAREVGLSVATVSRVINGQSVVREETRRRVEEAVERLGYVPNTAARSLITQRSHTLGVLLPDVFGEFFSELIRGIDRTARRLGYHVLISGSHSDLAETEAVLRALNGRVDGLVVMTPGIGAEQLRRNLPSGVPAVLINQRGAGTDFDSVRIDNRGGARRLVEHLMGLGHRRIALIGGPEDNEDARERAEGYREALAAGRLPSPADLVLAGDFGQESGYAAGQCLLGLEDRPTAVFAANDSMAVGCLFALREAGLAVPFEVALAGFDDIPIARFLTPALTSVHVPIARLGEHAVTRLVERLEQGPEPAHRHEVMPTELIVRASCGAPVGAVDNTFPGRNEP